MTYADELAALGVEVAGKISAITTQPADGTHAAAGEALGEQWDADLAAARPPVPPMLVGSSPGAWGTVPAMVKALDLQPGNIVRAFDPADAAGVPAGLSVAYSNDGGHSRGADLDGIVAGSTAYDKWYTELTKALRDDAPHIVIADHEFDIHSRDYGKTAREYVGLNLLLGALNVGRRWPVVSYVVTTGMPYDTDAYRGLEQVPAFGIGADNYARKHWDTIAGFGKRLGKPYGCFENGEKAQTDPSKFADATIAADMTSDFGQAKMQGFSVYCYWPNGGQDLTHRPISAARLKAICAANR